MTTIPKPFDFSQFKFAPVIHLPVNYEVYDFSKGYDVDRTRDSAFGIGRYNEHRPGMYKSDLFKSEGVDARDIHIGIDIAAPVGTPVHAFFDGRVFLVGVNEASGDYGGTLITQHEFSDGESRESNVLYALHGHLSHASIHNLKVGQEFRKGSAIAQIGDSSENGGWNPHLHFQLSWMTPERCDLPGVVNKKDLSWALATFPDPRLVLGPLY
jgi:murein DD-endopeptidase MepM/ murein hydrolase activator NlpD